MALFVGLLHIGLEFVLVLVLVPVQHIVVVLAQQFFVEFELLLPLVSEFLVVLELHIEPEFDLVLLAGLVSVLVLALILAGHKPVDLVHIKNIIYKNTNLINN